MTKRQMQVLSEHINTPGRAWKTHLIEAFHILCHPQKMIKHDQTDLSLSNQEAYEKVSCNLCQSVVGKAERG